MVQGHWRCDNCKETVVVSYGLQGIQYTHFWRCCSCGFEENNYLVHDGCYACDRNPISFFDENTLLAQPLLDVKKAPAEPTIENNEAEDLTFAVQLAEKLKQPEFEQKRSRFEILLDLIDQPFDVFHDTSPGPIDLNTFEEDDSESEWSEEEDDQSQYASTSLTSILPTTNDKNAILLHIQYKVTQIITSMSLIPQASTNTVHSAGYPYYSCMRNNGDSSLMSSHVPSKKSSTVHSGTNTSATSSMASNSSGKRRYRQTEADTLDQDENSDPDRNSISAGKRRRKIDFQEPRLACPFYKRDKWKCTSNRACRHPGWLSIHRVKEHLYRCHRVYQCGRCSFPFQTEEALEKHTRSEPCGLRPKQAAFGVNQAAYNTLKSRKGILGHSVEEQWRNIYRCFFPGTMGANIPSPWVFEHDQDFEDGTTNFMCTREHVIRLYQSELLRVLPDRLTSAFQTCVGDRRLKELFADCTSDSLRTMIQNTIQEFTIQYVAGSSSDLSSLDTSLVDGSPSFALSAPEVTKLAHRPEQIQAMSSVFISAPNVLESESEFFDIDQIIDESMHELKNELVMSAKQHDQVSLSVLLDQASSSGLFTEDDENFSWNCGP